MAQKQINGGIALPYSNQLPHELGRGGGAFGANCRSAGRGRGVGEDVFKIEMVASRLIRGLRMNLSAVPQAGGDLVIKLRDASPSSETDVAAVRLTVGDQVNEMSLLYNDTPDTSVVYETDDGFSSRVRTIKKNFFPSAWSSSKPRFLRINWTASTYRAKGWNFDEAEPVGWPIDLNNQTISSGRPWFHLWANGQIVDFHWAALSDTNTESAYKVSIGANETTTYLGSARAVGFTAERNDVAVPNATVRLYHQQTGALLGKATSPSDGRVTFPVTTDGICYAIVTDPADTADFSGNFLNKGS